MLKLITPNWSAPKHIKAFSSTRLNGESIGVFEGLNLGLHVDDDKNTVLKNRELLTKHLNIPDNFCWLQQTHSTILLKIDQHTQQGIEADASWSDIKKQVCVVMTADCLPVLITDKAGSFVSAIHAGWRGLCDGIIEKSIDTICQELNIDSTDLLVWLGPCIGKNAFEVGAEVRDMFINQDAQARHAFVVHQDRYLADLQQLARLRIAPFNVAEITASEHCTFSQPELFYSYRRDGKTGRMATFIYIE
ncbi:peptidoglycan editing factor PgeF [Psychromonas sp. KJ10-10]|uniref:peptidoglycan editing factor PgeF n=1 Tax=Psychromonas sp. KJ10-10 TaxID=3391823 RepID=UPI0039B41A67